MIVLRNVNLVDVINLRIIERVNLVVEQGVIASICDKDHTILEDQACSLDLDGYFATPGLIDLHTHLIWSAGDDPVKTVEDEGPQLSLLRAAHNARLTLNQGITCVRDLGSNDDATIALAKSIDRGYVPGPRVISAGCTIIMTGGHDPFWGIAADGPFELVKAVRNQIRKGARVIKISATGGVYGRQEGEEVGTSELTCEEIRVICQEAHRFGLKVAAHAISEEGIRNCIEAGVDTIEHGHFLTQEMMLRMKEQGMFWVPTLYVYQRIAEGDGVPEYAANKARKITGSHGEAFRVALNLELPFGAGSDAGSPNTPHGALLSELETMVACGCHPFSALQSATFTAARALGLEREIGALDVGKKADILILEKDPTCDIANLRNLRHIIKDGVFVER